MISFDTNIAVHAATTNEKDFTNIGFQRVWNPLQSHTPSAS